MSKYRIWVIGIQPGCDKLDTESRKIVENADLVVTAGRHRFLVDSFASKVELVEGKISEIAERVSNNEKLKVVFLASGDPTFFGIAALLLTKFDRGEVVIRPAVSSMQVAFAKAGLSWSDARIASLHGRDLQELVGVLGAPKVGLFTDSINSPSRIARFLIETGWEDLEMVVCSDLGQPEERIERGLTHDFADWSGSDLNVVLLVHTKEDPRPLGPGIPEELFTYPRGRITKSSVRAVAMGLLSLPRGKAVLWDVGAGSGSVGIEAALINPAIQVWAVERDHEALEHIRENRKKFRTAGLYIADGLAPSALDGLPAPDRVFIGGSGGFLSDVLDKSFARLREGGVVVVSTVLAETFCAALKWCRENAMEVEWVDLSFSRSKKVGEGSMRAAENPVTLFRITRPKGKKS
ncbi:MAG: hypothetical protein C0609_08755 [Deltaproteobacteria bacterium]|nr:MAG: hypothetical protein C0609_08755 [Deltaproteobacteria bacterium]